MRLLQECRFTPKEIIIPKIVFDVMSFHKDSSLFLNFLEYEDTEILEAFISPFRYHYWPEFYRILIPIHNKPGSTAKTAELLAKLNFDLKICLATDSIFGDPGIFEAIIIDEAQKRSMHTQTAPYTEDDEIRKLEELNKRISRKIEEEREYEKFIRELKGFDMTRYGNNYEYGKYSAIRKAFPTKFANRIKKGIINFRTQLLDNIPVSITEDKDNPDNYKIVFPDETSKRGYALILNELAKRYEVKDEFRKEIDFWGMATPDPDLQLISISFLNPQESIFKIIAEVSDEVGVLKCICAHIGLKNGVNLRKIGASPTTVDEKSEVHIICDISKSDYVNYTKDTMEKKLWYEIEDCLSTNFQRNPEILLYEFEVKQLYGLPPGVPKLFDENKLMEALYFLTFDREEGKSNIKSLSKKRNEEKDKILIRFCKTMNQSLEEDKTINEDSINKLEKIVEEFAQKYGMCKNVRCENIDSIKDNDLTERKFIKFGWKTKLDNGSYKKYHLWVFYTRNYIFVLVTSGDIPRYYSERTYNFDFEEALIESLRRHTNIENIHKIVLRNIRFFPTREQFNKFKDLPANKFKDGSVKRFGSLKRKYLSEKYEMDKFAIDGNIRLAMALSNYIEYMGEELKNSEINFIDIGCAGGALTALLCLNTLAAHGLLNKTNIYLADICEDVLRDNKQIFNGKNGDTFKELIESDMIDYINDKIKEITGENDGIMSFWRNRDSILKQIKKAKLFKMDSTKISVTNKWEVDNNIYLEWSSEKISKTDKYEEIDFTNKFDIVVSGFTHHHQNYVEKKKSCEEMVKIAKEKGFIGIVDECLTYEEYNDFLLKHKATEIPPSMESFISLRDHLSLFKDQPVRVMEYMDVDGKKWNFRDLNEYSTPKRIDMLLEKENLPPFSEISLEKKEYKYYYFSLIREL